MALDFWLGLLRVGRQPEEILLNGSMLRPLTRRAPEASSHPRSRLAAPVEVSLTLLLTLFQSSAAGPAWRPAATCHLRKRPLLMAYVQAVHVTQRSEVSTALPCTLQESCTLSSSSCLSRTAPLRDNMCPPGCEGICTSDMFLRGLLTGSCLACAGKLHFVKFETSQVQQCMDFIQAKGLHHHWTQHPDAAPRPYTSQGHWRRRLQICRALRGKRGLSSGACLGTEVRRQCAKCLAPFSALQAAPQASTSQCICSTCQMYTACPRCWSSLPDPPPQK